MENNRNHEITLNERLFGYSSLNVSDYDRPKYQIEDCIKMMTSILMENDQFNKCFLFHSTVPCGPDIQDEMQIPNGNDESIFQANSATAHCVSADAKMNKRFAETICRRVKGVQEHCQKAKTFVRSALSYWDLESNNFINNLVKNQTITENQH